MTLYIALLRGINVGGNTTIKMKALIKLFQGIGFQEIETYIQSGNIIFRAPEQTKQQLSKKIIQAIFDQYGVKPSTLLLSPAELEQAIYKNPFPEAEQQPSSLHLGFLSSVPENPNLQKLHEIQRQSERFELIEKTFYLHAPEGVGRSKLAANSEKLLGVTMTDRNWRTVKKIQEMLIASIK